MTRVVVVDADIVQRRLIVAQLGDQTEWTVDGSGSICDALTLKLALAALVILDWSNLALSEIEWGALRTATQGVPILVLASRADCASVEQFAVERVAVLYRPFTIGDVVAHAQELSKGKIENG